MRHRQTHMRRHRLKHKVNRLIPIKHQLLRVIKGFE